jgi:hypothetical protein
VVLAREIGEALGQLLDRIVSARSESDDLRVDLIVAITAHPLGYMVELDAGQLAVLDSAGCGVVFDVYSADDAESSA